MSSTAATPGWYPDPWYPGSVRWFDGASWTPYAAGSAAGFGSAGAYDGEKGAKTATWAGWAFLARGIAAGLQYVAVPVLFGQLFDQMREMTDSSSDPFGGFDVGAGFVVMQLAGLAVWACLALLCVWSFRATRNARAVGLTTTFEPAWAVAGWLLPLASLVMPWMTVRDLFPEGHPGRRSAGIWWASEMAGAVLGVVAMFGSLASSGVGLGFGVAAAVLIVGAGLQGRRLTGLAVAEHEARARSLGLA